MHIFITQSEGEIDIHLILLISYNKLFLLAERMNDVRQLEIERKRARFKELKEEAQKSEERKMEEKAKEIELEKKIALEAEEVEKEKKQREEKLK